MAATIRFGEANVRRRKFIRLLGGAATIPMLWPPAVRAQQVAIPVIGFLTSTSPNATPQFAAAFRRGLEDAGYIDGKNVTIEFRSAEGQNNQLPSLAAEFVRRRVAVIFATGGAATALAAKSATSTIPIVFVNGTDPVKIGLVASLNRPGGNVTGVSLFASTLEAKRLELLRELVPKTATIAILANPNNATADSRLPEMQAAARSMGVQLIVLNASREGDLDAAFAMIPQRGAGALVVSADPFFTNQYIRLVSLAARYAIPTMYFFRDFADAGGLMSYGASYRDVYRQAGAYTGRVLKGAKPADLPVLLPSRFELVINLKTAKTLGLKVPLTLQVAADEVIE